MKGFIEVTCVAWLDENKKIVMTEKLFINIEALVAVKSFIHFEDDDIFDSKVNSLIKVLDGEYGLTETYNDILRKIDCASK